MLYELNNPRPQGSPRHFARFGSRIGRAGDVSVAVQAVVSAATGARPAAWKETVPASSPKPSPRIATVAPAPAADGVISVIAGAPFGLEGAGL